MFPPCVLCSFTVPEKCYNNLKLHELLYNSKHSSLNKRCITSPFISELQLSQSQTLQSTQILHALYHIQDRSMNSLWNSPPANNRILMKYNNYIVTLEFLEKAFTACDSNVSASVQTNSLQLKKVYHVLLPM